jgi:MotA/TolQ/ExbB proton channel family.
MYYHIEGGIEYMSVLSILFITNLVLIGYALYLRYMKHVDHQKLIAPIHHVSLIALVWGALSTAIGLFFAFGSLAESEVSLPPNVIMGGMKVALITAIYGMIIFVISRLGLLLLRPSAKTQP